MMKNIASLVLVMVAIFFSGCASIPTNHGVNLFNVNSAEQGAEFTVVRIATNPAAALAEPYPSLMVYICQPAEEPSRVIDARQRVVDAKANLNSSNDSTDAQKVFAFETNRYQEIYYDWLSGVKPKAELMAPNGKYYRAAGIDFKDREGNIVNPIEGGEITSSQAELQLLEPWYGGEKVVIIAKPLAELISEGWRIAVMTSDDSTAKHVFGLDGLGLNGEKWGTRYSDFNPQVQGIKFSNDNPRIKGVSAGTTAATAVAKERQELILKAAIVAYKNDAVEFSQNLSLEEFEGFALNPFTKRWIERKSSRLEAVRQEAGRWEIAPMITTGFDDFFIGAVVMKAINISMVLFGNNQVYYFGSAGSSVTRYDFAVANLEIEKKSSVDAWASARNEFRKKYNAIAIQLNVMATDDSRRSDLEKQLADVVNKLQNL